MKKRVLMIMMAIVMTASLTACGGSESGKGKGVSKVEETEAEEEAEDEEEAEEAEEEVDEEAEADAKEDRKKDKDKDESDTPVIGNDVDDYDGFEYLKAYTLTGEDATAVVYAPADEYAFGGDGEESYVGTELNGVYVEYDIDAYVQYEQETFSVEENLDYYVSDWYEYRLDDDDVLDADMSEVKTVGDDAAYASITRVEYDDMDDRNYFVWDLYYLYQTDEKTILAEIEVDSCYDIEGAEDVVKELEMYLDADFDYDEDAMQEMADECDVTVKPDVDDDDDDDDIIGGGANEDGTFSTDYWTFELPEGWDVDPVMEDTNQYAYAPNGDIEEAECAVVIQSEYIGEDTSIIEDMKEDAVVEFIQEMLQEDIEGAECEMLGHTAVGYTIKAVFEYEGVDAVAYFVFDEYYAHTVMAMQYGGGDEAFDAAEEIIYSAEKN